MSLDEFQEEEAEVGKGEGWGSKTEKQEVPWEVDDRLPETATLSFVR